MKKNGFISTSLIYTFFILFLMLMIYLMNSYSTNRFFMEQYKYDIKNNFAEADLADINLYFMVWNPRTNEYELKNEMPTYGYKYDETLSYCKNGSTISYVNGSVSIASTRRDECYAYFKELELDIVLKMYKKESASGQRIQIENVPGFEYQFEKYSCTNGATIEFNEVTRKIKVTAYNKTTCEIDFLKRKVDLTINIYKENAFGTHLHEGLMYEKVSSVPGREFSFKEAVCKKGTIITANSNNELNVSATDSDVCDVYFEGGNDKVNLIIMKESDTGVKGYTTGIKYIETPSNPGANYKYVGYICDDASARVTYNNGILQAESSVQTTCRAYFNKYSGNVYVHYYIEKGIGSGVYENVSAIPSVGYIYNNVKSKCNKSSEISVNNNMVTVSATEEDECHVYFDMLESDIKILVYVMNRETKLYELSSVPTSGYTLSSASCTNGASIEYKNSSLEVNAEGPTVCTVYFY